MLGKIEMIKSTNCCPGSTCFSRPIIQINHLNFLSHANQVNEIFRKDKFQGYIEYKTIDCNGKFFKGIEKPFYGQVICFYWLFRVIIYIFWDSQAIAIAFLLVKHSNEY